jgi:hypothetical protein
MKLGALPSGKSDDVRIMQMALNEWIRTGRISAAPLAVDGISGPKTEAALTAAVPGWSTMSSDEIISALTRGPGAPRGAKKAAGWAWLWSPKLWGTVAVGALGAALFWPKRRRR